MKRHRNVSIFFFIVFSLIKIGLTLPTNKPKPVATTSEALQYLNQFGYLQSAPQKWESGEFHLPPPELRQAIQTFQSRFGLRVTGQLDRPTRRLMAAPRCGNPDFGSPNSLTKSKSVFQQQQQPNSPSSLRRTRRYAWDSMSKWSRKELTYKIKSYPTSGLSRAKVHSIVRKSLNVWSKIAALNFKEVFYPQPADMIIAFGKRNHGDSIPFDGPQKTLAHAYFPNANEKQGEYSLDGDTHFDDDEVWIDSNSPNGKSLLSVAVHEFGHSLGLGHAQVRTAIMYPYYVIPQSSNEIELDADDIEGIVTIYGRAEPNKALPPVPNLPREYSTLRPTEVATYPPGGREAPDVCDTDIDAVVNIRSLELFVFRGAFNWRIKWSKLMNGWHSYQLQGQPFRYENMWSVLKAAGLRNGIDTMIEAKCANRDTIIYIFRGSRVWLLENNEHFVIGTNKSGFSLTYFGLPGSLTKVDSMFRWGYNGDYYLFAGDRYWKFDCRAGQFGRAVSAGYPQRIASGWKGVPSHVDAVHTDINGVTYFIKGRQVYAFNNEQERVYDGYPRRARLPWLGCPATPPLLYIDKKKITADSKAFFNYPSDATMLVVANKQIVVASCLIMCLCLLQQKFR